MARNRRSASFAGVATVGLIAASFAAPAVAATPQDTIHSTLVTWCDTPSAVPCIDSANRDGTPITSSDTTWGIDGSYFTLDVGTNVQWVVDKAGAAVHDPSTGESYSSMGPSEAGTPWSVTFRLPSTMVPRVTSTYADDVSVDRSTNVDGTYEVTVTGKVVTQPVNAECNFSTPSGVASCPVQSSADITAFQGEISDFGQWNDASQLNDFYGMDSWTNVEATSIPPTISGDPLQISEPLANSYQLSDGTVFSGFYHVILPNQFLEDMGIDDPSTLDPSGVNVQVGAGTVSVTPGPDSTEVDATGITFAPGPMPPAASVAAPDKKKHATARIVKIKRGTITPTAPAKVTVKRHGSSAKVGFGKAKERGSKIKSYQARCLAAHRAPLTAVGKHSPVKVTGLTSGVSYRCQVRAKAKAGYGHWSAKKTAH